MTERDFDTPVETPTVQPAPAQGAKPAQTVPVVAVVLAAGFGTRFDPDNPKQLVSVGGKPIVCWSIDAFEHCDRVSDIVVVVNPKVRGEVETLVGESASSLTVVTNVWTVPPPRSTCWLRLAFRTMPRF